MSDTAAPPQPIYAGDPPIKPLSWGHLYVIEIRKMVDTRGAQLAIVAAAVLTALMSWVGSKIVTAFLMIGEVHTLNAAIGFGAMPVTVTCIWLSISGTTAEWQHNTATSQFPLLRSRTQAYLAKLAAASTVCVALALIAVGLLTLVFAFLWVTSRSPEQFSWGSASGLVASTAGSLVGAALTGVAGVGLGSLIRRSLLATATGFVALLVSAGAVFYLNTRSELWAIAANTVAPARLVQALPSGDAPSVTVVAGTLLSVLLWYVVPAAAGGYRHVAAEVS